MGGVGTFRDPAHFLTNGTHACHFRFCVKKLRGDKTVTFSVPYRDQGQIKKEH